MNDKEKLKHSEATIRQAFKDTWAAATNRPSNPLMSIPPRPDKDADFILHDALDELFELRAAYDHRQKEIDEAYERGKQDGASGTARYKKGMEDAMSWWAERIARITEHTAFSLMAHGMDEINELRALREELNAAAARVMEK